jgi:hypothetical protein
LGCRDPAARSQAWLGNHGAEGWHPSQGGAREVRSRQIAITLDTYSHVTAGLHEEAAEQVAALIQTRLAIR